MQYTGQAYTPINRAGPVHATKKTVMLQKKTKKNIVFIIFISNESEYMRRPLMDMNAEESVETICVHLCNHAVNILNSDPPIRTCPDHCSSTFNPVLSLLLRTYEDEFVQVCEWLCLLCFRGHLKSSEKKNKTHHHHHDVLFFSRQLIKDACDLLKCNMRKHVNDSVSSFAILCCY